MLNMHTLNHLAAIMRLLFSCGSAALSVLPALGVMPLLAGLLFSSPAAAQDFSGAQAAVALENAMTEAIAAAEDSVVAIARARKGLGERLLEPDFIPNEYGTGVVIDRRGLILTNYHVLGDPAKCDYAVWIDRRGYPATIKAADDNFDLAVLEIKIDSVKPIALGDAKDVRKGQIVIALGNPFAIARDGEPSATWGIISNLRRKAAPKVDAATEKGRKDTLHHFGTLIQTDARLDRGTSGGALLNLKGEMIGLTTSVAALPGSDEAAGFAIPVNDTFRFVVEKLKAGRSVPYGFLGVAPDDSFHPASPGVLLTNVVRGTPAAQADLHPGDIVTHVEDESLRTPDDLMLHVGKFPAERNVRLRVLRRGQPMEKRVTLSKKYSRTPRPSITSTPEPTWRGVKVDYSTAHPRFVELSHDADPAGCVVVTDVEPDSAGWKAGLRSGTFISHVGTRRVTTPDQFHAAVGPSDDMRAVRVQLASQFGRLSAVVVKP